MSDQRGRLPWVLGGVGVVLVLLTWVFLRRPEKSELSASEGAAPVARAELDAGPVGIARASPIPQRTPSTGGRALISGTWGSGPGQFGWSHPKEGNPEAPMALAVDAQGRRYVMDQVNGRIQRFGPDGTPLPPIKLTQAAPQDFSVGKDGSLAVMDRNADKSLALFDPDGHLRNEVPLLGKNLPEGGAATGVFRRGDELYVEREHGMLVHISDAFGNRDPEQTQLDGRPTPDDKTLLSAAIIDASQGTLWVRAVDSATQELRFQKQVTMPEPILEISLLQADRAGRIYLAAHLGREAPSGQLTDEVVQVSCFTALGQLDGSAALPANPGAEQSFRDLTVGDDGTVYYMLRSDKGLEVRSAKCM